MPITYYNQAPRPLRLDDGIRVLLTPNLPPPSAAIGDALQNVSANLAKLHTMAADARDIGNTAQANIAMNEEADSFTEWRKSEPDEAKWLPEWNRRHTLLGKRLDAMPLTEKSRAELNAKFKHYTDGVRHDLNGSFIKQINSKMLASIEDATNKKQFDIAKATVHIAQEKGLLFPEQGQAFLTHIGDKERQDLREEATTYVKRAAQNGKPDAVLKLLAQPYYQTAFADTPQELAQLQHTSHLQAIHNQWARTLDADIAKDPRGALERLDQARHDPASAYAKVPATLLGEKQTLARHQVETADTQALITLATAAHHGLSARDLEDPAQPYHALYTALPPQHRAQLDALTHTPPANDPLDQQRFQTRIAAADLTDDLTALKLRREALSHFSGPHLQQALQQIDTRLKGDKAPHALAPLYRLIDHDLAQGLHGPLHPPGEEAETDQARQLAAANAARMKASYNKLAQQKGLMPSELRSEYAAQMREPKVAALRRRLRDIMRPSFGPAARLHA